MVEVCRGVFSASKRRIGQSGVRGYQATEEATGPHVYGQDGLDWELGRCRDRSGAGRGRYSAGVGDPLFTTLLLGLDPPSVPFCPILPLKTCFTATNRDNRYYLLFFRSSPYFPLFSPLRLPPSVSGTHMIVIRKRGSRDGGGVKG